MPLKDKVEVAPAIHGAPCSIAQLYRANFADPEEIAEFNTLLYEEGNDAGYVWRKLQAHGYKSVARSTVNKHRGGNCRCFTIDRDLFCDECKRDFDRCVCGNA